jgi:large subunit ribosomal protein L4
MEANVVNLKGKQVNTVELPGEIFDAPVHVDLMHQAFVRQMANRRLGTHNTRTRSEVRGGGRKPWRQKGTGRARQGSIRAPQWVGGGKVHTPKPRSYEKKMPRKMRKSAVRSALAVKFSSEELVFVDEFVLEEPKTRLMAEALKTLVGDHSCLLVYPEKDDNYNLLVRAIRNLPDAKILLADYLNIRDLLSFEKIVLVEGALEVISLNLQLEQNDDIDL